MSMIMRVTTVGELMPDEAQEINKTLDKRMMHSYQVDAGLLVESLVDGLSHDDLVNIVVYIDIAVADKDFTQYLFEYFKQEVENGGDFND